MDDANLLLEIKDLKVRYKTDDEMVYAVEGLSLKLNNGETLGLVGETGAGKTTTALAIMGLIPSPPGFIESGDIIFKGESLLKKNKKEMKQIRGKDIAMIFQDPMTSLNPVITVGKQISEMILLHTKVSKQQAREMTIALLAKVGIKEDRVDDYPHQFSGGMKQRVVIAIALACNPGLLIADEPTTALDVTIQSQILDLMKKLKKDFDASMIMITHDLGIVADICDTVAIIYAGAIVEYGTKQDVYNNPSHPYTQGLFYSIPDLEIDDIERLQEIKGLPPDPTEIQAGCSFRPRCTSASDSCKAAKPPIYKMNKNHYVSCHLYKEENRRK